MLTAIASPPQNALSTRAHAGFLARLPLIELHARFACRHIACPQERSDAVAEAVGLVWKWYCRLLQRGKDPSAFVATLAHFAARHVKSGRRLCGNESSRDVMSRVARRRRGFRLERLKEHGRYDEPEWQEALQDNTQTPVADAAAFRIDFPQWLQGWSDRDRRLIEDMAVGEKSTRLARKYGVSDGRIAQKRTQYRRDWERFAGEAAAVAVAPAAASERGCAMPEHSRSPEAVWRPSLNPSARMPMRATLASSTACSAATYCWILRLPGPPRLLHHLRLADCLNEGNHPTLSFQTNAESPSVARPDSKRV